MKITSRVESIVLFSKRVDNNYAHTVELSLGNKFKNRRILRNIGNMSHSLSASTSTSTTHSQRSKKGSRNNKQNCVRTNRKKDNKQLDYFVLRLKIKCSALTDGTVLQLYRLNLQLVSTSFNVKSVHWFSCMFVLCSQFTTLCYFCCCCPSCF